MYISLISKKLCKTKLQLDDKYFIHFLLNNFENEPKSLGVYYSKQIKKQITITNDKKLHLKFLVI